MTSSSAHGSVLIFRDYISLLVAESAWTAPTDGPLMEFNTRSRETRLPTLAVRLKVNRNVGNLTVGVVSTPNNLAFPVTIVFAYLSHDRTHNFKSCLADVQGTR